MKTQTFSLITKEVSQTQIWKLVSNVDNWKEWDDSVEYSTLYGTFETGNRFTLKPKGAPKVSILLDEVRPEGYFRDLTKFPFAKMFGEHWYEETSEGLKITITMTIYGCLSSLWYRLVMKDIVANLEKDIKTQIENAKLLIE